MPRWVILVEGSTSEAVNKVLAGPLGKEAMPKVDNLAFSTYALQYDLLNDLRPACALYTLVRSLREVGEPRSGRERPSAKPDLGRANCR